MPWSGVITNYSTSPFAEEIFEKLKDMLHEYEVVINRWPQYTLILENVSSAVVLLSRSKELVLPQKIAIYIYLFCNLLILYIHIIMHVPCMHICIIKK